MYILRNDIKLSFYGKSEKNRGKMGIRQKFLLNSGTVSNTKITCRLLFGKNIWIGFIIIKWT